MSSKDGQMPASARPETVDEKEFRRKPHPATGRGFYGSEPGMHSRRWILVPFRGASGGNSNCASFWFPYRLDGGLLYPAPRKTAVLVSGQGMVSVAITLELRLPGRGSD